MTKKKPKKTSKKDFHEHNSHTRNLLEYLCMRSETVPLDQAGREACKCWKFDEYFVKKSLQLITEGHPDYDAKLATQVMADAKKRSPNWLQKYHEGKQKVSKKKSKKRRQ